MRYAKRLLCAGLMLSTLPARAAATHFWVGFDAVKRETASAGSLEWVPVSVGSDETPQGARPYTFAVSLTATGPGGFACSALKELTTKVKPPVTVPLRFQVSYPNRIGTNKPARGEAPASAAPRATYRLGVKLTGDVQASHSFAVDFPEGGRPACIKLN